MKKFTKNTALYAVMLGILLLSLVALILNYAIPIDVGEHEVLNFAFCLATGFGVLCLTLGFLKKAPQYFFLSAPLLTLALVYVLVCVSLVWWLILIIAFVTLAVVALLSLITAGNKTENIALNKSPEYKNYEQRKAEKEQIEAEKPEEELPEIKSFK